jgi:hypothetical protein
MAGNDEELTGEEEERWCAEQRGNVLAYLRREGFDSPNIGKLPAWHIASVVSVWAVESLSQLGNVGWWAVSGDLPTDYTTCQGERHPRQALRDIGLRWQDAAARWARGEPAEGWGLDSADAERELAPMLATRAALLLEFAQNDVLWEE